MNKTVSSLVAATMILTAGVALAATDPAVKCEAAKNKAAGAYYACRQKADATAAAKGGTADYSKCLDKFNGKWSQAETAGAGTCPDDFETPSAMENYISTQSNAATAIVGGAALPTCGDGAINTATENCDGAALGGKTCASFGKVGTLACTAGCDYDISGCTLCPGSTFYYKGACWTLGTVNGKCSDACTALGLAYDTATLSIAGSGGTDSDCLAVLSGLGTTGNGMDSPSSDCGVGFGLGCAVIEEFGFRARCALPATTSTANDDNVTRACACK